MKVAVFSAHAFEREFLIQANKEQHELILLDSRLTLESVVLAKDCHAICIFTGDKADAPVLEALKKVGVKYIALRSAGFNHVDVEKANSLNIKLARVPAYSPYAIAEHAVALILSLNRKIIKAHNRIQDLNFSLDGLVGFDMNGKTVGVIGTGKIGAILVKILHGFGCRVLAFDLQQDEALVRDYNVEYTDLQSISKNADVISLHVPLNNHTKYLVDADFINQMKPEAMLINTSRGGLVDTKAVINALKKNQIGAFGMDVYEEEEGLFFVDHSEDILQDDVIARLMTFKNVLITSHQAFLTKTALTNIADTTFYNLACCEKGEVNENVVS